MNIIGEKVIFKSGEEGIVVREHETSKGSYIINRESGEGQFDIINAVRGGFITFANKSIQDEVLKEIGKIDAENDLKEKQKEAANKAYADRAKAAAEAAKKTTVKVKSPSNIQSMFGPGFNGSYMNVSTPYTYQEVENIFGIKLTGFGKGINPIDDGVVLISSMDKVNGKYVYHDHWTEDGFYIFSGEGKTGDQKIQRGNKAIIDAAESGKKIHLIIKLSSDEYYYQGLFVLDSHFFEKDYDENGKPREEIKFKLKK